MNVLIVSALDIHGGAARAAYRLHHALLAEGIESRMLVQNKKSDEYTILAETGIANFVNKVRPILDDVPLTRYKDRSKTVFSPAWAGFSRMVDRINALNPDIVHLHWICMGMLRIEDIAKIRAPVVWTLHDMWPFTGGCHYNEGCDNYVDSCGNCPVLGSKKAHDLSRKVFLRKQKTYGREKELTVVALSRWLAECSQSSTLFEHKKHVVLPNPIDTAVFKPFDRNAARTLWNLPTDKKLILFGAMSATSDPRKGYTVLTDALGALNENTEIAFVVFGSSEPETPVDLGHEIHYLGALHDDVSLVTLYSAVDVTIVPSLQENLSNVVMESLACATPVVAFDVGGNGDLIDHKQNGYLAQPFETADLKAGIEWVLYSEDYDRLCRNARQKVVESFDSKVVAGKYIALYNEVLGGR